MIRFCLYSYTCSPLLKMSEFSGIRQGLSVNINLLNDTALKEVFKSEHLLCERDLYVNSVKNDSLSKLYNLFTFTGHYFGLD